MRQLFLTKNPFLLTRLSNKGYDCFINRAVFKLNLKYSYAGRRSFLEVSNEIFMKPAEISNASGKSWRF
jgi:hypothetical protein